MSTTLDRLRRLHRLRPQTTTSEADLPPRPAPTPRGALEQLVPGRSVENEAGGCYVTERRFALSERRGSRPLGDVLGRDPLCLAPYYPVAALERGFDFRRAAFIDTETTGLGGGAGIYAFLVGVGTFESAGGAGPGEDDEPLEFVVRQYFMRHPGEECGLLVALGDWLSARSGLVTFNGRTFDLPLLRGRYRFNRGGLPGPTPALLGDGVPHLDLLHPARRLWKARLASCALGSLEQGILEHRRSDEDVPGHLIPLLYARYLQTREAGDLRRIFYHNLEDIVSMVALADQICRLFAEPLASAARGEMAGLDLLSLARAQEQVGDLAEAERSLRRALELVREGDARADCLDRLGRLLKRQERWPEAVEIWQQWITSVPGPDPRPFEELAKYCEWQTRDLGQAEMWTAWALHNQQKAAAGRRSRRAIDDLTHRLQRIQGKQAGGNHPSTT